MKTEGFVAAIQDQVIPTRAYRKRILKEKLNVAGCRMCGVREETLDHLISGCSSLAPKQYLDRHNRVAGIIHKELRKKYMAYEDPAPYYQYEPPPVTEDLNVRLYWNRKIITDKPITNNIPDIVLTVKDQKTAYIIDIAVPLPNNIARTNAEKINKYLPLVDEIKEMWNLDRAVVVPIVVGATGEIPKRLLENLRTLQLDQTLYKPMQKSVLLDTCSIVRRVLGSF